MEAPPLLQDMFCVSDVVVGAKSQSEPLIILLTFVVFVVMSRRGREWTYP